MYKPKRNTAGRSFYLISFDHDAGRKGYKNIFVLGTYCLLVLLNSCHEDLPFTKAIQIDDSNFKGTVKVEKIEKLNKYRITIKNSISLVSDKIYTPYEIFAMETGDINHDGKTDICIGIIKPTPFDPTLRKRLFIFQIDHNYIRPLWLSSRLVHPLEGFKVVKHKDGRQFIITIEKKGNNTYCISEYNWESFGMSFVREYDNALSFSEAWSILRTYDETKIHI
jgi:hypothetical protein